MGRSMHDEFLRPDQEPTPAAERSSRMVPTDGREQNNKSIYEHRGQLAIVGQFAVLFLKQSEKTLQNAGVCSYNAVLRLTQILLGLSF